MTYSEILVANFESTGMNEAQSTKRGLKNPNLENLEVENDTSNALDMLGNLYPCQPVDLDASMERDTWMDQNKEVVA